ncbi:nitronate monooxygenase [Ideonella dechloratans]|uniref:Nitronate monooxygenase n=1 Tax=Ideonella dechloratans TaxID=36863 RepID=A0A643FC72_IDEDE|nr:nitronate monooxygenase family protein [Ideonella dechloratans]KAB0581382.1 nitronate monooxygenase [Ideonella dechloratans]UFU12345.1 nitronate monooxygenase family protein [Ideonella dechloratans]
MSWLDSVQSRLSLPVIASPMFIVSNPRLVAAECKAGIVGSFPALNARPAELLDEWLTQLKAELATHDAAHPERPAAPFAVNQICHRSNDRLMRDMETCVKHQVPIIITSLQVSAELVAAAHSYGGVVFHDVTTIRHAEKAIEAGVDGLILVCAGAGGHAGTLSPFALLPEIRRIFKGPIALAGAIANGQSILAAQALGADFAYMGTRFIATQEANAVDAYKQMLVDTRAEDIVYSSLFTGVPGNYLKPSIAAAGMDPDNLPSADKSKMDFGSGGNSAAKAWRDIWGAGQGVGSIDSVPSVAELVDQLKAEYREARENIARRAARFGA